jgi:7,8-dihydro-6-hydroxymethylpterin-pyrophosphokinase
MVEDVLNNKISAIDEKFITTINMLMKQSHHQNKRLLSSFVSSIEKFGQAKNEFINSYNALSPEQLDDEMKKIEKKVEKVKVSEEKIKTNERDDDIIEVDDDPFAGDDDDIMED